MWKCVPVFLLLVTIATPSFAFDDDRKGFVLGFGTGLTAVTISQEFPPYSGYSDVEDDGCGYRSQDIVIGWGITERVLAIWNTHATEPFIRAGFGLRYYMRPKAPSVFFTGGVSPATHWDLPRQDDCCEGEHTGWWLGAAYEFSPHLSVQWSFTIAEPEKSYHEIPLESRTEAVTFLITYLGY